MNLNAFLNPVVAENKKIIVSERFVENAKPVEWELKAISAEQDEAIRKSCVTKKQNKKNMTREFNSDLYLSKLAAECVVYPDLHNVDLQNAYDVMSGEDLLKKMLTSGEYYALLEEVQQINGFDKSYDDLLDEAKN